MHAANTYAQDGKITLGVRAGLNIASISNKGDASVNAFGSSSSVKTSPKFLPHLGLFSEIKLSDDGFFSLQPELLFSMRGYSYKAKASSGSSSSQTDIDLVTSYIDIPLQLKFNFGKGFYVMAGPYVGFLLTATSKTKTKVVNGSTSSTTEDKDTSKDGLNTMDAGMYLGAGYQLESGLSFAVRWCRGFSDINDYGSTTPLIRVKNSNNIFQFSVGFRLKSF